MKTGYDDFFKKARREALNTRGSAGPALTHGKRESQRFTLPKDVSAKGKGPRINLHGKTSAKSEAEGERIEILRERLKSKRGAAKKKRGFPLRIILGSLIGAAIAGVGLFYHEDLDRLVGRVEIEAMGIARAESPAAKKDEAKETSVAESKERSPAAVDHKSAQWSDDEINHLQKLVQRKEQLDAREAELQRLEAEIQAQNAELDKKLKSLEDTRQGISTMLQERTVKDEAKVDTLVQMYSNMKPAQAAKILESMDEDLAVEIIGRMKKKNAAEVLNLMKSEKAQVFSEKFAGYRKR